LTFVVVAALSGDCALALEWKWIYVAGAHEIGVFLAALAGGCLGFLWYNAHPAQVFMGDTGSLGMGGVLGACAVLMRQEFLFALVSAIFVAETLSVMLQVWSFKRYNKRIFLCSPLHHHFEYKGWTETKVVARFWIIGFILSMLALVIVFERG
jgi:phospho-N-acetylmuramoyl-pentapeptide-transferase